MSPRNCEIPRNDFDWKSQKCTTVLSKADFKFRQFNYACYEECQKKRCNKHTAGIASDPMRCSTKMRKKLLQNVV